MTVLDAIVDFFPLSGTVITAEMTAYRTLTDMFTHRTSFSASITAPKILPMPRWLCRSGFFSSLSIFLRLFIRAVIATRPVAVIGPVTAHSVRGIFRLATRYRVDCLNRKFYT